LFVLPSLAGGGAERVVVSLVRYLDRSRFEPHLALLKGFGVYLKDVPEDVPLHDLKTPRVRYAIPALVRVMNGVRPDVAISSLCELNFAMAVVRQLLRFRPALLLREDSAPRAQLAGKHFPALGRVLYSRLYPWADRIICVSDHIIEELAGNFGIPRSKLTRIYNPMDPVEVRRRAEIEPNPYSGCGPQVVAVGRLERAKGFDLLLEAMVLVRRALPTAQLTVVGEGPSRAELEAQQHRLGLAGAVHFVGYKSNPYPFMKHASLLVISSRFEGGSSLVALEALALEKSIVATDCPGGMREVLENCPMSRLVPSGDAGELAAAIVDNLGTDVKAGGWHELYGFLDRFRPERVIRQYEDLLVGTGRDRTAS
jgi:glycosyltransferase involved in cell wall biosynthesis